MYDGTPSGMGPPNGEFLVWWWGHGGGELPWADELHLPQSHSGELTPQ